MKYMIMTFGSAEAGLEAMGKEWMLEMIQFMRNIDDDLRKSGEMVSNEGLSPFRGEGRGEGRESSTSLAHTSTQSDDRRPGPRRKDSEPQPNPDS